MPKRGLLTSSELADQLGVSQRTITRYALEGKLTPAEITIGGHYRWDLDDVRRQLRELRKRPE